MPTYDDGESFAADDENMPQFDNVRLRTMWAELKEEVPERSRRVAIWAIILKGVFGDADIRGGI